MERHYTTIEDVIAYEVESALGNFVNHYDVEAIARDCYDVDAWGQYERNDNDFWEIAQRHDLTQNWDPVTGSVSEWRTTDHGGATLVRESRDEARVYTDGFRYHGKKLGFVVHGEPNWAVHDFIAEAERKLRKLEEKWVPVNCDEHITIEVI
jgi:hypothetical protein